MNIKSAINNAVSNVRNFFRNQTYTEEANLENTGILKAYIPQFLYKPPYGYPRMIDVPTLRNLAVSPYVHMVITTILNEVCSVEWDIVPKEKDEPGQVSPETLKHIKEVKEFFYNPNGNDESFEHILRAVVTDILTLDSGVIVKVFNRRGKLKQIFARDGGTFLKNPDIYGYLGNRADIIYPVRISDAEALQNYYDTVLRYEAAYFQYGWTAGSMPIPFGKREIVWISQHPRTDSIYGRSAVEVLQDVIMSLIYGAIFNLDFYTNNNMPDGVIQLIGANQEQIKKFRERFEKQFKIKDTYGNWRKQFHKYPIVNMDIKFTPFQLKPEELQIISQQQWFSKIVWACFNVTPSELGFTEGSNKATELVQSKVFKRKAVRPLLKLLEYHINTQIIPEFGYDDIKFKFNDFDVVEETERAKLFEIQLRNGIKTINEVRGELGLLSIEGGDKLKVTKLDTNKIGTNEAEPEMEEEGEEKEPKLGEEEEIPEEKALTTQQPTALTGFEKIDKAIKEYLEKKKKEVEEIIKSIYESDKLSQIKSNEYKDLWTDLINKIENMFVPRELINVVENFVKETFIKSLENEEKKYNMNFFPRKEVLEFLKSYNFNLVKDITEETANDLRALFERSYMNNLSKEQVIQGIKEIFNKSITRAKAIYRTETDRIDNIAKIEAGKQSGLKLKKTLRIVDDERTSPLCKRMYRKYKDNPIDLDEKFKDDVTGEEWNAPPLHVQCRSSIKTIQEEE
jgi:HK97 family phage portal protein